VNADFPERSEGLVREVNDILKRNLMDMDQQTTTSADWLLSTMIGYEKYIK
jgi:hypothetical protein